MLGDILSTGFSRLQLRKQRKRSLFLNEDVEVQIRKASTKMKGKKKGHSKMLFTGKSYLYIKRECEKKKKQKVVYAI